MSAFLTPRDPAHADDSKAVRGPAVDGIAALVDFGELLGFRPSDVIRALDVDPFEFWGLPKTTCALDGCENDIQDLSGGNGPMSPDDDGREWPVKYCSPEHMREANRRGATVRKRKSRAQRRERGGVEPRARTRPTSDGELVSDGLDILRRRGISEEVQQARGYRRYARGASWVTEEFRAAGLTGGSLACVTRIVKQSEGWLMPKHPVPGAGPILPQLRPDVEVITDPRSTWHYHGEARDRIPGKSLSVKIGTEVRKVPILKGRAAEQHIHAEGKEAEPDYDWRTGIGVHRGVNQLDVHKHAPRTAKYILQGKGQRIDIHPLALERLASVDIVFFAIEGTPKTDAILSAGGVSFGVPSVTMWPRRELHQFADDYLADKVVIIVPDADWATNYGVAWQALKLRTFLRQRTLGRVAAFVAAPPVEAGLKGVDDFLAAGHRPDELVIMGREPDYKLIAAATEHIRGRPRDPAARMLEMMILVADERGHLLDGEGHPLRFGAYGSMAISDRSETTSWALGNLTDTLRIEGSLETEIITETIYDENLKLERDVTRTEFKQTPTISINERFRAPRDRPLTVRDIHSAMETLERHEIILGRLVEALRA